MSALPLRSTEWPPAGRFLRRPTRSNQPIYTHTFQIRPASGGKMVWHKTVGSGPTKVVVIHGWFWDHRVFTPIFDCLDAGSTTFAFIDIRGYGNSRDVSGEYSIG